MWWVILVICMLSGLTYLLFAPIFFEINTASELFRISFHQLLSATLVFTEKSVLVELKAGRWKKQIDFFAPQKRTGKPVLKESKGKRKSFPVSGFTTLIKSFRINYLFLTLDTGNMPLNGLLYPVFLLLNKKYRQNISINFFNNTILILQIENKIAWILWAFVKATILK